MTKKNLINKKNNFANLIWLFSEMNFAELSAGDKTDIQIMRVGTWKHACYGDVVIEDSDLEQFVKNFDNNVRRIKLAVDENHDHNHKAVGWFKAVKKVGNALFATIEWNERGAELINSKEYRYFSPELSTLYTDDESGKVYKNVLLGGGITNRPFFKAMKPLMMSENNSTDENFYTLNFNEHMKTLLQMLASVADKGSATDADKASILKAYNELPKEDQSDEIKTAVASTGVKFDEEPAEEEKEVETPVEEEKTEEKAEDTPAEEKPAEEVKETTETPEAPAEDVKSEEETKVEASAETVEASEKTVVIKASELKQMQKTLSEMAHKQKTQFAESETNKLTFSESNKQGMIMPKEKEEVIAFAASLSDSQATKFYEIMGKVNAGITASMGKFHEIGVDTAGNANAYSDEISFLQKTLGLSKEDAEAAAKEYTENKKSQA